MKLFAFKCILNFLIKKGEKNNQYHFRSSVFCLKMKNYLWTKLISPWMILDSFENKFLNCGGPTKCAQSSLFASIISSPFKVATQPVKKTSAHKVLPQIKPFRSREVWITFFLGEQWFHWTKKGKGWRESERSKPDIWEDLQ